MTIYINKNILTKLKSQSMPLHKSQGNEIPCLGFSWVKKKKKDQPGMSHFRTFLISYFSLLKKFENLSIYYKDHE